MGALTTFAQQKVKDGTVNTINLPNKDAILELESRNKGLLHPRVALIHTTDASPLTGHVAGMMVYNTAAINDVMVSTEINKDLYLEKIELDKAIKIEHLLRFR
ncbi:MAG: hypothetical protein EOO90_25975 [Pedobacter sp.]|nr:MAG: hypothetical protein EOO90_25975 [Pedobacter sp.]